MVWSELHCRITPIPTLVGFFAQLPTKMLERPRLDFSLVRFDIFWYVSKRFLVLVVRWSSTLMAVGCLLWNDRRLRLHEKWKKNPNHEKPWITRSISFPPITILITKINETLRNNSHWLCFGGIYEESFQLFSQYWIFTVFDVKKSNFFEKLSI
jgi:hypothetical protein